MSRGSPHPIAALLPTPRRRAARTSVASRCNTTNTRTSPHSIPDLVLHRELRSAGERRLQRASCREIRLDASSHAWALLTCFVITNFRDTYIIPYFLENRTDHVRSPRQTRDTTYTYQSSSKPVVMRLFSFYLFIAGALSAPSYGCGNSTACRCRPDEPCWPSDADWQSLNETVSGQLSRVSPLGAVCHDPAYDEEACTALLSGGAYDSSIRAAAPGRFRANRHAPR